MKFENVMLEELTAVSAIDGRYAKHTKALRGYFCEFALIYHRWRMEILYLLALDDHLKEHGIIKMPPFTQVQREFLVGQTEEENFSLETAKAVKAMEKEKNHDVEAVKCVLKDMLRREGFDDAHLAHVHFGLTSEDVNNLSYAPMIMTALEDLYIPAVEDRHNDLLTLACTYADDVMISRTHGQPATPTTFGKEMQIAAKRIKTNLDMLYAYKTRVKVNGPSGNYNGHMAAYPQIHWPQFMYEFVKKYYNDARIGKGVQYEVNDWTAQIEDHDTFSELFAIIMRINVVLIKFSKDIWLYISNETLKQKPKKDEVGSSAMPHKVNPINFENAEGNLIVANALLEMFVRTLPDSRLQRHLSDSTIIRNFGTAFGHCLIACDNLEKGIEKIELNRDHISAELDDHAEVISEAYQLIMKREGHEDAYETLKVFTRGKKMTLILLHEFVDTLSVSDEVKDELKAITPANYLGLSKRLATGYPMTDPDKALKDQWK